MKEFNTVLIVDDLTLFAEGLKCLLHQRLNTCKIITAKSTQGAIEKFNCNKIDLVILDLTFPDSNGKILAEQLLKINGDVAILVVSMLSSINIVRELLDIGVNGYLLKDSALNELQLAISTIAKGEIYVSAALIEPLNCKNFECAKILTLREKEILIAIAKGGSSKEIAANLYISKRTVDVHRRNILNKLELRSAADLTRYAIQKGYLIISTDKDFLK